MSTRLKLRRGTGAEHAAFTGETGEITLNTTTKAVVVHDGTTAGGVSMARADLSNVGPVVADLIPAADVTYSLGSPTNRWADLYVGNNTIYIGDNTRFSGTSLVIDGGENPTSLTDLPTLIASKIVAKPFTYNAGGGNVTVRPSIEFQAVDGTSYPISFDTATNTFSLDAAGNFGSGSLVAKKITLTNDGATALRVDGNATLGYDATDSLTVKAAAAFQGSLSASGAVALGDGNDAISLNAGGANTVTITASNFAVDSSGNLTVGGNLTVRGTTTTIDSNTVNIGDNIVILNADIPAGQDPTENAGIQIARGSEASAKWYWDEVTDAWTPMGGAINNVGSLTVSNLTVTGSTTGITASLADTGVTAGTYTNPTITVDATGRVTAAVNGTGVVAASVPLDYALAGLTEQTTGIAANAPVLFNSIEGDGVTLNTSNGQFTLKAGKTYLLTATVRVQGTTTNAVSAFRWYNNTKAEFFGNSGQMLSINYGANYSGQPLVQAVITPTEDTQVSLRFVTATATAAIHFGTATIQEIGRAVTPDAVDFSASEQPTGQRWIDGKMIYQKTVAIGALPTTAGSSKTVAHGITGATLFLGFDGFATNGTTTVLLPHSSVNGTNNIAMSIDSGSIFVTVNAANWSSFVTSYVTVKYVK